MQLFLRELRGIVLRELCVCVCVCMHTYIYMHINTSHYLYVTNKSVRVDESSKLGMHKKNRSSRLNSQFVKQEDGASSQSLIVITYRRTSSHTHVQITIATFAARLSTLIK